MFGLTALFVDAFTLGSAVAMFKSLGLMYLGAVAFSAIFFFFTTLFNNSVGGVVSSLVISLGIFSLIEMLLDMAVKKIFSSPKVLPTDIFYDSVFMNFSHADASTKAILIFAGISVAYIALSLFGSMMLQQKRDVK